MSALLRYALPYTRRGWPVLWCEPGGKAPLTPHGVRDATTDAATIRGWAERWPDGNLAIATGAPGPTVRDVDDRGAAGEVIRRLGALAVPVVATARGVHFYFAGTERGTVRLPFGELRGRGGYVLAPPSLHPSGCTYTWTLRPNGALPALPAELAATRSTAGAGVVVPVERVPPGAMYAHLLDLAIRLVRAGVLDGGTVERVLAAEFEAKRVPGATYGGGARDTRRLAEWAVASRIAERERRRTA